MKKQHVDGGGCHLHYDIEY